MKRKLGDLAIIVKSKDSVEKIDRNKYVTTENMISNRGGVSFPSSTVPKQNKLDTFDKDDVLVSNIRPYFKKIWKAPFSGYKSGDVLAFRTKDRDILSQEYLYILLESDRFFEYMTTTAKGTKMPRGDKKAIAEFPFDLPSIDIQKKRSHQIEVIEQKISLNQQINANLVELSNTIFKQILVSNDLHEFTINDIGTVAGGGTPSKKIISYWNGNIPWLSPKDLSNKPRIFTSSGENYITQQGLDNSSTKLLPRNTVLFSSRAPIGYLSIAKNRIATNQGFKSVIPNKQYPFWFIYELLKVETPRIINEANGSTFKEVSGSRLKQHIVYVPKSSDVLRYNSIFISLFQKVMQSESEIDTLNSLKRALLNKLF